MRFHKKRGAVLLALLFSLLFPLSLPCAARAEAQAEVRHYDVMLVVDKSGSLRSESGKGTDPDGLRFDALRLFLGLLTESGNNVGAITFDEQIRFDSGIRPMESMEDKKALIEELEYYTPGYDTDIGSAVLRAAEELRDFREQGDAQTAPDAMILLFSDGKTDFTGGDTLNRLRQSFSNADQAVTTAREAGVAVNGILLNADSVSDRGDEEFRLYAAKTGGRFEEVRQPEDLGKAFLRLYEIINGTHYTGAQRVAFSDGGEAELFVTVPSFGVEEVNVIIEGEKLRADEMENRRRAGSGERVEIEILDPGGEPFEVSGHELNSARCLLVKIPHPHPGVWHVRLKGQSADWVDFTMVCNASLSVTLQAENPGEDYRTLTPYPFTAAVDDPGVAYLTQEQLSELDARLEVENLMTGGVRELPMALADGAYTLDAGFPRGGEYRLRAVLRLGDFELRSDPVEISVKAAPLKAVVDTVTDMQEYGSFRGGVWELELAGLFGAGKGAELDYALSDDCGGMLQIEDGVLKAAPRDAQPFSFTLTAGDQEGQSAQVDFTLTPPPVKTLRDRVTGILKLGRLNGSRWEIGLDELFSDPKDAALDYALSDDCGGAVTLANGLLRVELSALGRVDFTLSATDIIGKQAELGFSFAVPAVTAKLSELSDALRYGSLDGFRWEIGLDELFSDPKEEALSYALSDDCGGAVALAEDRLTVDFTALSEAAFTLSATDSLGRQAVIPVRLRLPGPAATASEIRDTVKTGLFQKGKGIWEQRLDVLFRDPKGGKLRYSLSDDLGGAAEIDGRTLRVNVTGLKEAAFSVAAEDEYDMRTEVSITLTEQNMTLRCAMWALLGLLALALPVGVVFWLRRRSYDEWAR